jgi:A/G-specific adenine glycosylase
MRATARGAMQDSVLAWYSQNGRDHLPWRHTHDPYAILVSEVMLQQTQVARVLERWPAWLERWPTAAALAAASPADVLREWVGLGYNRRAVRLHAIAREAVERLGGQLPTTPDALRELEGLWAYTANAVACFSAEAQVAVVDTNVRRVLGRVFADEIGLEPPAGPALQRFADAILRPGQAYPWNQALMDLGATICTARNPDHDACPLALQCTGRTLLSRAEPIRRAAESGATYKVGKTGQPFEQTTSYYRGRIVDACRELGPGESLGLDDLGQILRSDYGREHQPWVAGLVAGLQRDGLVAVDEGSGEPRVSLP